LPNLNSEGTLALDVTFASGKHTTKDYLNNYNILQSYSSSKDMVFNLSVSNLEVYADGLIYKNTFYSDNGVIKVTGSTSKNQIIVHGGKHRFEFENVSVDYTKQTDKMFFVMSGESDVVINNKKQNTIKTGCNSVGFYVGTNAKLSFAGTSNEDKLTMETFDDSFGFATPSGSIQQFGGTISITAKQNSIGVYLGNAGDFSLYNGVINGISSTQNVLYGLNDMKVNVYGGIMNMDNIGYRDEANEEISDESSFTITNGEVNISNRMIFSTFEVTGGTINAHLLGSGIGSKVYMYQGKIAMDKFITNPVLKYDEEKKDFIGFTYITPNGVTKESALDTSTIYGGDIEETHNVTIEELRKISFGRC
jgi:mannose-6-phosphate isomerase-like protein (cupin superfamily)